MRYWALPFIGLTVTPIHCGAPEPQSQSNATTGEESTSTATQADLAFKLPGPGNFPIFPGLPPTVIPLSGDLRAPDPSLIRDRRHGDWYVFSTGDPTIAGGAAQIRHSTDLKNWTM